MPEPWPHGLTSSVSFGRRTPRYVRETAVAPGLRKQIRAANKGSLLLGYGKGRHEMNILILSELAPTNKAMTLGGLEVLRRYGAAWVRAGHQVAIVSSFAPKYMALPAEEDVEGIRVVRIGRRDFLKTFHLYAPVAYRRHWRRWADVVIESLTGIPLGTPLYVRDRPLLFLVYHLSGRDHFRLGPFLRAAVHYLGELTIPYLYRKTLCVAISEPVRQNLVRKGVRRVVAIPLGVDLAVYYPGGAKTPHPSILYVGVLDSKRKRLDDLMQAFQEIRKEFPELELRIAGSGKNVEEWQRRAQQTPGLVVLGHVDEATKVCLYRQSWVHVLPSVKEGFGLTPLEASACGTPSVAYDILGLVTVRHGETGVLVPPGDVSQLATAVAALLRDADLRQRMAEAGRRWARSYNWEASAAKCLELLTTVRQGARSHGKSLS